jgi:hypothetical protein
MEFLFTFIFQIEFKIPLRNPSVEMDEFSQFTSKAVLVVPVSVITLMLISAWLAYTYSSGFKSLA